MDKKANPRPRETEPAAIGRDVRRGMILLFLLTAEIEMAVDKETARKEETKAIRSELNIALSPVPAPVGEEDAISSHAFNVNAPSFVKKAL